MEVMGISLEIPAEILRAVKLPAKEVEQEFCKELSQTSGTDDSLGI
jgi:hypothetical protein